MPNHNTNVFLENGSIYNRLTILSFSHNDKRSRKYYLVKCKCGKELIVHGSSLKSGNTKSCGCLIKDSSELRRLPNNHSEIISIINGYKRHAKERNLEWNLSFDDVKNIILKNCYYCNNEPSNLKKNKNSIDGLKYNGIDRFDNNKGYIIDNCKPCCKTCNYAKSDYSMEEFKNWIEKIYKNLFLKEN